MKEIKDLGFGIIQVNEPKLTMSKMKSVDNYLCKWQKLKEWLEEEKHHNEENLKGVAKYGNYYTRFTIENSMINLVLDKMQELEGEDE